MMFFCFWTATDGFPGLWMRPLPGAGGGSSQRRRNRECADWPKGRRADDHVRKEISFPSEKTEKAVYTISLVAQSARSEAGKHRQLFLMRWVFAGSNPCTPKRNGDAEGGFAEQSAWPLHPKEKWGRRRRLCGAKCLTLSAIQQKAPYTKVCGAFLFQDCHRCRVWLVSGIVHKLMV